MQEEEQGLKVKDLMTRNLTFVGADDSVMEAAKLMGEREISSVLVKGGGVYRHNHRPRHNRQSRIARTGST